MKRKVQKFEKYQDLKREIGRLWGIRHLEVVLVVVGTLGVVSNRLDAWLEKLGYDQNGTVIENSLVRHS